MVNGHVDIVEWMLRLQLGHFMQPLDLEAAQREIKRSGWSIEVSTRGRGGGSGCLEIKTVLLADHIRAAVSTYVPAKQGAEMV
jgi:hypothetical protein